ncbi:hypothetical protein TrLO_g9185 [Triparma laevis f. longispina]|uniref:Uncharacterized protein n=1 Tax=Triparma laevis f. longispina TaxID=1714387 RepID=A0A9W7FJD1_9STRA|nr:hypothetical protein TrLO_g9185 [Triparma laevis f. longispina]
MGRSSLEPNSGSKKKKQKLSSPPPPTPTHAFTPPPPAPSWTDHVVSGETIGVYHDCENSFEYKALPSWPTYSRFLEKGFTEEKDFNMPSNFSRLDYNNSGYNPNIALHTKAMNEVNSFVYDIPESMDGLEFVSSLQNGAQTDITVSDGGEIAGPFQILHCIIYKHEVPLNCAHSTPTSFVRTQHAFLTLWPGSVMGMGCANVEQLASNWSGQQQLSYLMARKLNFWPADFASQAWLKSGNPPGPRFESINDKNVRPLRVSGLEEIRVKTVTKAIKDEERRREGIFEDIVKVDMLRIEREKIEEEYGRAAVIWKGHTLKAAKQPTSNPTPDRKLLHDPRVKSFITPKGYETALPLATWVMPFIGEDRTVFYCGARKTIKAQSHACDFVLHKAAKGGQIEHVRSILDNLNFGAGGIDIDTLEYTSNKDKNRTALSFAAQKGFTQICELLIERGADVNAFSNGSTSLIQASHFGKLETVQLLLSKNADVLLRNNKKTSALMRAAQEGHLEIVRLLTTSGSEVAAINSDGMSSVMLSSQRGHTTIVSHLLSLRGRCDINAITPENKSTCLHLAVKRGHLETIKVLLREGADVFKRDKKGKTPGEKVKEDTDPRVKSLINFQSQVMLMREKARLDGIPLWRLGVENNQPTTSYLIAAAANHLPADVFLYLVEFIQPPSLYGRLIHMVRKGLSVQKEHDAAISLYLDFIRDMLEECFDFLEGLTNVEVGIPQGFATWAEWSAIRATIKKSDASATKRGVYGLQDGEEEEEAESIKTPSLQRGGFSQEGTSDSSRCGILKNVDSGLLAAYGLSPICYLQIISLSPVLRDFLVTKGVTPSLIRALGDVSDVETSVRRRKGNVMFNKSVEREVYEVAIRLAKLTSDM